MNHPGSRQSIVRASAPGNVRRFKRIVAADSIFTHDSIALDSVIVGAVEQYMRWIVMPFAERDFEFFADVQSDGSQNEVR